MENMLDACRRNGKRKPEEICFSSPKRDWRFGDLESLSNRLAQAMLALELVPGDRIACLTKHAAQCTAMTLAAQKIGAVCMPVNWRLAATEVSYILNHGQAKVLMTDIDFVNILNVIECPSLKKIVLSEDSIANSPPLDHRQSLETWAQAFPDDDPGYMPHPQETALQLYSSGQLVCPKALN
jgi:acyl-coenzyme A synthetase/AMP-(fatty) acid ligase